MLSQKIRFHKEYERNRMIARMRKGGVSLQAIGTHLGLTKQRVAQVCSQLSIKVKIPKVYEENYTDKKYKSIKRNIIVDATTRCWEWQGGRSTGGYAATSIGGQKTYVHRFMYEYSKGSKIKEGNHICHTCDNPSCVNPDHLWEGTAGQNMMDRDNKKDLRSGYRIDSLAYQIASLQRSIALDK